MTFAHRADCQVDVPEMLCRKRLPTRAHELSVMTLHPLPAIPIFPAREICDLLLVVPRLQYSARRICWALLPVEAGADSRACLVLHA